MYESSKSNAFTNTERSKSRPIGIYRPIFPQICIGASFSVYLSSYGVVYSFGANGHGQLGHGDMRDRDKPTKIKFFTNRNVKIAKVMCSQSTTFFVTSSGKYYCCGRNSEGNLGLSHRNRVLSPTSHPFLNKKNVKKVKLGGGFNLFSVQEDGKFALYGCGDKCCLGIQVEEVKEYASSPTRIPFFDGKEIDKISCGNYHYVVRTAKDGKLYSSGCNKYAELGRAEIMQYPFFKSESKGSIGEITFFSENDIKIKSFACGGLASYFSASDGKVYYYNGSFSFGGEPQCCLLSADSVMTTFGQTFESEEEFNIFCGGCTVFFVSNDGKRVRGCGNNKFGELGLGWRSIVPVTGISEVTTIKCLGRDERVVKVRSDLNGKWVGHTLVLTNYGRVMGAGSNARGQLSFSSNSYTFSSGKFTVVEALEKLRYRSPWQYQFLLDELSNEDTVIPRKELSVVSVDGATIASITFMPFFHPEFQKMSRLGNEKIEVKVSEDVAEKWEAFEFSSEDLLKAVLSNPYDVPYEPSPDHFHLLCQYVLFRELDARKRVYLVCREVERRLSANAVFECIVSVGFIREDIEKKTSLLFRHPLTCAVMNVLKKNEMDVQGFYLCEMRKRIYHEVMEILPHFETMDVKTHKYFEGIDEFPLSHLHLLFETLEKRTDFNMKLECEGMLFNAHAEMLLMSSEMFRRQFSFAKGIEFDMFRKKRVLPMTCEYFTPEVIEAYLTYIYSGEVKSEKLDVLFNLLNFAHMDENDLLQESCVGVVNVVSSKLGGDLGKVVSESVHLVESEQILHKLVNTWAVLFPEKIVMEWIEFSKGKRR